ncbi:MAG: HlyD family efflux transporter periplasmic adaptor subunit [Clostridia bacterium]|nr:HlyD family efflux transporter periplasmic adaptor subunit [Clostridia bacterium]
MRRRQIKPRFFVFLALLLAIVILVIRPFLPRRTSEAVVMQAATSSKRDVQAVVVRDEQVVASESTARIEFVAAEGTVASAGDEIAYVYSAGYTEKELAKLETIRQNIQAYHKTLLSNIVDAQLERLDSIVDSKAVEFRNMVLNKANGNLLSIVAQLETAMVTRQEYMRQNKREDTKLTKLYSEENSQLNSISTWRNVLKAEDEGVATFYLDGYEEMLSADSVDALTAATLKRVLEGQTPSTDTRYSGVYKLVKQSDWYVAVLGTGDWNPIVGQEYEFQLKDVPDVSYTATVTRVQKSGDESCVVLSVSDPMGPLLYYRSGEATLSINLQGLSVPREAVVTENGQTGVWTYDGINTAFVAVDVLSQDRDNALVQAVEDGTLSLGMRVLIR